MTTRSSIIYFDRRFSRMDNARAILAKRDELFPRTKVPMHRIRWVATSKHGGYWTL